MKNKILTIIFTALLLLTIISITACNSQSVDASNSNSNSNSNYDYDFVGDIFTVLTHYRTSSFYIIYDNQTKVMYAVSDGHYNAGNLTMLVNADGTPKLYDGE